jgi:hypothetical protein
MATAIQAKKKNEPKSMRIQRIGMLGFWESTRVTSAVIDVIRPSPGILGVNAYQTGFRATLG